MTARRKEPLPAHLLRPADKTVRGKARRKAPATVSADYARGFFTALLWPASNWPHAGWTPQCAADDSRREAAMAAKFSAMASAAIEAGRVWPMVLPGTPVNQAPGLLRPGAR
jgi:hypothetical protein